MPRYVKPPVTDFMDEIDVLVKRNGTRYVLTVEHRPTRLGVESRNVKWCKLHTTKELLIEELREKVRKGVQ